MRGQRLHPASFELVLRSSAAPEQLFTLLSDAPGWPTWFRPARRVRWVATGPGPGGSGAGAVREVWIGPLRVREEVLAEEAPHHHAYSIRGTLPVRDHRADVWLEPAGGGTTVRWTSSFVPAIPVGGAIVTAGLRLGVRRLGRALVRAAESRAAAP